MSEIDIQNRVTLALSQEFGAAVSRIICGKVELASGGWVQGAPVGTADLIACIPSPTGGGALYFEIEVKTPTGRQRPEQKKRQAAIAGRGGSYLLVRSPEDAIAQVRAALAAA